jgi:hypothetical protein
MTGLACSEHPAAAAAFGCDGCGRLLCERCVVEGHRLITCGLCGERALPLDPRQPADVRGRRAAAARAAAMDYGWADALRYPLRGQGRYALAGGVVVLVLLLIVSRLGGGSLAGELAAAGGTAALALGFQGLLALFVIEIARGTAAGADELPDWPEVDLFRMIGALLRLAAALAVSLLPAAALAALGGCALADLEAGSAKAACLALVALGLVPSTALWLLAFGATAVYESPWLFFRLDLHARAAAAVAGDLAVATAINGGLAAIVPLAWFALALAVPVTFVAAATAGALSLYAVLLSAHLAGVIFRRNPEALERIYLG